MRDQSQEGMKTAGSHVKMCPIRGSPRLRCPLWADAMQMMVFPQLTQQAQERPWLNSILWPSSGKFFIHSCGGRQRWGHSETKERGGR